MKVEQRTVYVISDGLQFDTEAEALEHGRIVPLVQHLERFHWCDMSTSRIAEEILGAFVVIPRLRAADIVLAINLAAEFIAGFEDDQSQEGIADLVKALGAAMETLSH